MKIITFINQKGGSGKTTTCVNIGACLAHMKKKVLLIDIDPQANATIHIGIKPHQVNVSLYDVLIGKKPIKETIIPSNIPHMDIIPSNINLTSAEIELVNMMGREKLLKHALKNLKNAYDFILIDSPPSLGLLTLNALIAGSDIIIPIQSHFFALEGMSKLLNTIKLAKERLDADIRIKGIVLTLFDERKNICKDVALKLHESFKNKVFSTKIRDNIKLAEAPSYGQSIIDYAPQSYGAQDYRALTKEVLS